MRLISTRFIMPGMVTAAPVFGRANGNGTPLVSAAVPISDAICRRLRASDVPRIYIDDPMSEGIDPPRILGYEHRRTIMEAVRECEHHLQSQTTPLTPSHILKLDRSAGIIIEELYAHLTPVVGLNDQLLHGSDPLSIAVSRAVIGAAIAREYFNTHGWTDYRGVTRIDRIPERVNKLVIGLLLADIGMSRVSHDVQNASGILDAAIAQEYQRHPTHGVRLLTGSNISPLSRAVVAQHHESFDGSGYPRKLARTDINVNARIAAAANTVMEMCTGTPMRGHHLAEHDAWSEICAGAGTTFDPHVIDAFISTVAPYAPGTCVELSDGRAGIVQDLDPIDRHLPTVRITHDTRGRALDPPFTSIELASTPNMCIQQALECLPTELGQAA